MPQGSVRESVGCFVHYGSIKEEMSEIIPDLNATFHSEVSTSSHPCVEPEPEGTLTRTPTAVNPDVDRLLCFSSDLCNFQPHQAFASRTFAAGNRCVWVYRLLLRESAHLCSAPESLRCAGSSPEAPAAATLLPSGFRIIWTSFLLLVQMFRLLPEGGALFAFLTPL